MAATTNKEGRNASEFVEDFSFDEFHNFTCFLVTSK